MMRLSSSTDKRSISSRITSFSSAILQASFPSLFPALFPTLPLYLLMWHSGLYLAADARLAVWRASTDDICLGMLRTRRLSVQRERAV